MGTWEPNGRYGFRRSYVRKLEGLDRIRVYVDFEQWDDEDAPLEYQWQVSDGSCGRKLDYGSVDGDAGLAAAMAVADAAAARLFPGH